VTDAIGGRLAAQLRREFDASFAEPPGEHSVQLVDLLAIRLAGNPYALRLNELSGLSTRRPVTPVPTAVSGLLGIAGIRGMLVPVYDLRLIMGHPATETALWLGLVGSEAPIGLAFDGFEGHLRVPREAITRTATRSTTSLANEVLHTSDPVRLLVHLPSVLAAIRARAHQGVSPEEK